MIFIQKIDKTDFEVFEDKFDKEKLSILKKALKDIKEPCEEMNGVDKVLSEIRNEGQKRRKEYEENRQNYLIEAFIGSLQNVENNLKNNRKNVSKNEITLANNMLRKGNLSELLEKEAMNSILSYLRWSHMMKCLQNDEKKGILKILDSLQAAKGIIKHLCDKRNIDLNNFIGETSEIIINEVCPMIENVLSTPTAPRPRARRRLCC